MGINELVEGEFEENGKKCQYSIGYLNVQESYWLCGQIIDSISDRRWHFDKQSKTPYLFFEIKKIFEKEMDFMTHLSCHLL